MDILNLEAFLLWCLIINYSILIVWFIMIVVAKDFVYNIHTKWFNIPKDKFDSIHYMWMGFYKYRLYMWLC